MSNVLISSGSDMVSLPVQWDAQRLHGGKHFETIRLTLKPGEIMPLHINRVPVVFWVLEGEGDLLTEASVYKLSEGDWAEVDAGCNRGWQNTSAFQLILLVVKSVDV